MKTVLIPGVLGRKTKMCVDLEERSIPFSSIRREVKLITIYRIRNIATGKRYVGQTKNLTNRIRSHAAKGSPTRKDLGHPDNWVVDIILTINTHASLALNPKQSVQHLIWNQVNDIENSFIALEFLRYPKLIVNRYSAGNRIRAKQTLKDRKFYLRRLLRKLRKIYGKVPGDL